ncbi:hypothetical protein [Jannaschia sp. LMIT008]|uniref:hypothetical protein n=1 Tax=Jannaschia maritima TaxID=3032585 RepID=UPI00281242B7|nr:hypothetical protein [Jannaschia sp. LMIT008]
MLGGLTLVVAVPVAAWWALVGLGLWAAARMSRRAVWLLTGIAMACLLAAGATIMISCYGGPSGEVVLGEVGNTTFGASYGPCGGPGRVVLLLLGYVAIPIAAIGQALLTRWMLDRAPR